MKLKYFLLGFFYLLILIIFIINLNNIKDTFDFNYKATSNILKKNSTKILGNNSTPIYIIDNFLSDNECNNIILSCKDNLIDSPLTRFDSKDPYFRTSKTSYFNGKKDQDYIENKILNFIKIPKQYSEDSQVQYYSINKEFKPHYDYFHKDIDDEFLKNGQRTWTFMIYLNDVKKGGHTHFHKLNQDIYPKKGRAVIWSNLHPNGIPNEDTLHQGNPVEEGEKWIITKWFLHN